MHNFEQKPLEYLIKKCDERLRESRIKCAEREEITNAKHAGYVAMKRNGEIITNSVKKAMWHADSDEMFEGYVNDKFKHNAGFIDAEARNLFKNKNATASLINCAHGDNHCGIRDAMINGRETGIECPRCNQVET